MEIKAESKNKTMAILARIFPILFFLPIIGEKDEFGTFHANQALLQLLLGIAISIVSIIPVIGWIVGLVGSIASFVFWIMGIIAVTKNEMKPLPVIGGIVILK